MTPVEVAIYRLAEMAGRADVETFAGELSIADLLSWGRYWRHDTTPGTADPDAAVRQLRALLPCR